MKKIIAMLLAMVMVFCLAACNAETKQNTEPAETVTADDNRTSRYDQLDKIYIGITATLTGKQSQSGNNALNGAKLAVKQINEAGGLLGKQVELVYEDEGEDQQTAVNACAKLLTNEDLTAFWGGNNSSYGLAYLDMVKDAEVVFFVGGSSAKIHNEGNCDWAWQSRMTDASVGPIIARASVEELAMKKPIILASTDSFGSSLAENIKKTLEEAYGITGVEILSYNVGDTQFGTQIAKIQNSDADGLIATSTQSADAACIINQVAEAGLEIPCIGSNGFSTSTTLNTAGEAANGWYTVTDWSNLSTNDAAAAFESAYVEEYGVASDMQCAYCYDSIMLIAEGIRIAGSQDPKAVNEALKTIENYQGAMSLHTYHENHSFATSLVFVHVEDGKCVPVSNVSF